MFKTKFEDNELTVTIDEQAQKKMMMKGINPVEVFRLIESFAQKILTSKKNELIQLTNEDTGASLELDVQWQNETEASVNVTLVNLDNLTVEEKPRSKVNLGEFPDEPLTTEI